MSAPTIWCVAYCMTLVLLEKYISSIAVVISKYRIHIHVLCETHLTSLQFGSEDLMFSHWRILVGLFYHIHIIIVQ